MRAEDARTIQAVEGMDIELWVRAAVRHRIELWHATRAQAMGARPLPKPWAHHAIKTKEE